VTHSKHCLPTAGTAPGALVIRKAILDVLTAHAGTAYPDECCGMIISRDGRDEALPVTNVQNELHAADPSQFPRTARTAYTMGAEAAPILIAAERGTVQLRAFYHSHPDHEAYFSEEDRQQAFGGWDEPSYPDAAQIVLSVRNRMVGTIKAFAWDATLHNFVEIPLTITEP
jgi:[CysO sulfur-carrier protein]-S-L-cysteine hydrolase